MEWTNWYKKLPRIIEANNHIKGIQILDLFYKHDSLKNPNILIETQDKLLIDIQFISHIKLHYNLIISYIKANINSPKFDDMISIINQSAYSDKVFFYTTKYTYKSQNINLLPIHPYAFGIPFSNNNNNNWIDICKHNNIPSSITFEWNQNIFTQIRIKVSKDSNFYFEIKSTYPFTVIREYGNLIYCFDNSNSEVAQIINICLKKRINTDETIKGIVSISCIQHSYHYDQNQVLQYIHRLENLIKDISNIQKIIYDDHTINKDNIEEYKEHFNKKINILQQITQSSDAS